MAFLFLFGIGGLTGLFLGTLSVNVPLHNTHFVVAHFHYVIVGGTVMGFLAGIYYWWPKITGRMYHEAWGRVTALVVFAAFNLTFFPLFILGARGMVRRYYDYSVYLQSNPEFTAYNVAASVGGYLLVSGLVSAVACLVASLWTGRPAPDNPWGAASLEWRSSSPPPHENAPAPPQVGDPYDYSHLKA